MTAEEPHHATGGGAIRQAHLLTRLATVADVHLLLYGQLTDPTIRACCASVTELPAHPTRPAKVWRRRLTNLRTCLPGAVPHQLRESRRAVRSLRSALAAVLPSPSANAAASGQPPI